MFVEDNNHSPLWARLQQQQQGTQQKKSNIARVLSNENVIPWNDIDPDAFITVLVLDDIFDKDNE